MYINNMQFPRSIQKSIDPWVDKKEIVVVTGMRRTGKTTLLRMIYQKIESSNKVFLDMENVLEQRIFEETDFNNIWANLRPFGVSPNKKAYVFIDEVQARPAIIMAIKYLYDHYDVKFFLTGSSSFYLKNLFPESLAGRKATFELFPLDFREFLIFKGREVSDVAGIDEMISGKNRVRYEKQIKLFEEYLTFGGFPQVVLDDSEEEKCVHLKDIFSSYFEKDVRALADFRNRTAFRDLLFLLMQRVGSKVEAAKLASEVGIARPTVLSYLAFLEGTYFVFLVEPFSPNRDREISGARKLYFCDNGFLSQFGRVSEGTLLENAVYLNLRKYGAVRYYQKRTGPEIDFVIPDLSLAVEVKKRGSEGDRARLDKLAAAIGLSARYVVSQEYAEGPRILPAMDL
jgi:predicted AAA+ superfamily ATPase